MFFYYFIFIWKGVGAGEKKVPGAGASQKRIGSTTLVLKHILVKFLLGRDSKLSMFNILGTVNALISASDIISAESFF